MPTPDTHRCVYILPADLHARIRAYQTRQGIASEVEAARRLIYLGIECRETVTDVLDRLMERFLASRDIRFLAAEVLVTHPRVDSVEFSDYLNFTMDGRQGKIGADGRAWILFGAGDQAEWRPYPERDANNVGGNN